MGDDGKYREGGDRDLKQWRAFDNSYFRGHLLYAAGYFCTLLAKLLV